MDGTGGDPTAYRSITEAVQATPPGNTIWVRGMEIGGTAVAYCEVPYLGTQGAETFPIRLKPGMVIRQLGSTPVYVWSNGNPIAPALFSADPNTSLMPAKILDLVLGGCLSGFQIDDRSNSGAYTVLLKDLTFAWLQTGVDILVDKGASVAIRVQNPRITDASLPDFGLNPPPNLLPPSVGFRFHALATDPAEGPGLIDAEVNGVSVQGTFRLTEMDPLLFTQQHTSIEAEAVQATRLIEVYSNGQIREHPITGPTNQIAEVVLSVAGGVLDGHADADAGWDIGLYCGTQPHFGGQPLDYHAGYEVTTSGVDFDRFRMAGIYGTVGAETRGSISLDGGTRIARSAIHWAGPSSSLLLGSGVLLSAEEGLLALYGDNAEVAGNLGNGITLVVPGTIVADTYYSAGLYLDLSDCNLNTNGGHGLRMVAGKSFLEPIFVQQSAIVGGTWIQINTQRSYFPVPDPDGGYMNLGQGVVDRCAISNNGLTTGGAGVSVYLEAEDPATGTDYRDAVCNVRFTNDFVWNNGGGAYVAQMIGDRSMLLTPVLHSTLVGNATASPNFTLDIQELPRYGGIPTHARFQVSEGLQVYRTTLMNSIFQRHPDLANFGFDFSPSLWGRLVAEVATMPILPNDTDIGAEGIRCWRELPSGPPWLFRWCTEALAPFVHPAILSKVTPEDLFLQATQGAFSLTPDFQHLEAGETGEDYTSSPRPPLSTQERDKGAYQQYPR